MLAVDVDFKQSLLVMRKFQCGASLHKITKANISNTDAVGTAAIKEEIHKSWTVLPEEGESAESYFGMTLIYFSYKTCAAGKCCSKISSIESKLVMFS